MATKDKSGSSKESSKQSSEKASSKASSSSATSKESSKQATEKASSKASSSSSSAGAGFGSSSSNTRSAVSSKAESKSAGSASASQERGERQISASSAAPSRSSASFSESGRGQTDSARSLAETSKTASKNRQDPVTRDGPNYDQFRDFVELSDPRNRSAADRLTDPGALDRYTAGFEPSAMGGALGGALEGWIGDQNDYRDARIAEREAAGVVPSEGPIDWNAITYDLNAPVRARDAASPTGDAFEGAVDWGGIADALGGMANGALESLNGPAPRIAQPDVRGPNAPGEGLTEAQIRAIREVPGDERLTPDSGFLRAPNSGTLYNPDAIPDWQRQALEDAQVAIADGGLSAINTPTAVGGPPTTRTVQSDPIVGLANGIDAERRRLAAASPVDVGMPRARPTRGGIDAALPGQTELYAQPAAVVERLPELMSGMVPGARAATVPTEAEIKEPTIWDNVVDMSGSVLEHTALGGLVKDMFPDVWYGAGETFKGNPNGGSGSIDDVGGGRDLWGDPTNPRRSLTEPSPAGGGVGDGFTDADRNGIDDRLEHPLLPVQPGAASPAGNASGYDRFGNVLFPDMPPYRPGIDNEWLYFRRPGYAEGGIVDALPPRQPDGMSPMAGLDPRVALIAEAEDALEGDHPNPEQALKAFVDAFGEEALQQLAAQVKGGMTLKKGKPRLVEGKGGPKDDAIPARIDEVDEAALSNGEFVMTADAVANAGDGDPRVGAERLMQLNERLSGRPPAEELIVEKVQ